LNVSRILMTADAIGGVWQYSLDLAGALAHAGVETVLVTLGPPPSDEQRRSVRARDGLTLVETDLSVDWLAEGPAPMREAGQVVARLARESGADLVHYNMPTLAAGAPSALPSVVVTHGCVTTWWAAARGTPLAAEFEWHRDLTREGLRAADATVAPSHSYAAVVAEAYEIERPVAVHNGRNRPALAAGGTLASSALTVGRLWDEVKNAALLDRVAARAGTPIRAAGAVRGPHGEEASLRHLAVLGTVSEPDLASLLAERPIFISPARFEPFGLAVLEAASAGCALVLADIPTFRELWDGAALFVQGEAEDDWARAIDGLAANGRTRGMLGAAAAERAARYTPEATAAAMLDIYRSVLVSPPMERVAA
jgi:glycosyltransferase involved in cell wall biosynthesis